MNFYNERLDLAEALINEEIVELAPAECGMSGEVEIAMESSEATTSNSNSENYYRNDYPDEEAGDDCLGEDE